MKIWAHSLVKNEARWLWFSVNSIIQNVDKLLLWDTGSIDGSLEIEKKLKEKYPDKIELKQRDISDSIEFTAVRQEMLDATKSDWFIMLDGDEIWWEDSIIKVIDLINGGGNKYESVVVPTINLVGDIFHYQDEKAGKYRFGDLVGHYNLRAIKRNIPGLHSEGAHGVWGWADDENKMIQDRKTYKFIDAPYLHATNLERSVFDKDVIKRGKKHRYEIGNEFSKDFYYPEVFFRYTPKNIESPWSRMSKKFKARAFVETPLRKIKRRIWTGKAGY